MLNYLQISLVHMLQSMTVCRARPLDQNQHLPRQDGASPTRLQPLQPIPHSAQMASTDSLRDPQAQGAHAKAIIPDLLRCGCPAQPQATSLALLARPPSQLSVMDKDWDCPKLGDSCRVLATHRIPPIKAGPMQSPQQKQARPPLAAMSLVNPHLVQPRLQSPCPTARQTPQSAQLLFYSAIQLLPLRLHRGSLAVTPVKEHRPVDLRRPPEERQHPRPLTTTRPPNSPLPLIPLSRAVRDALRRQIPVTINCIGKVPSPQALAAGREVFPQAAAQVACHPTDPYHSHPSPRETITHPRHPLPPTLILATRDLSEEAVLQAALLLLQAVRHRPLSRISSVAQSSSLGRMVPRVSSMSLTVEMPMTSWLVC